jgi:hypothetical protein
MPPNFFRKTLPLPRTYPFAAPHQEPPMLRPLLRARSTRSSRLRAREDPYDEHVFLIFEQACLNCHNPDKPKAASISRPSAPPSKATPAAKSSNPASPSTRSKPSSPGKPSPCTPPKTNSPASAAPSILPPNSPNSPTTHNRRPGISTKPITKHSNNPDRPPRERVFLESSLIRVHIPPRHRTQRRGGRVVDCTGLENRRACKGSVGSNPTPTAIWLSVTYRFR